MIPFESWDGSTDQSGLTELSKLESFFGPTSVVFNTYQSGVTAVLEILGSRIRDLPVVLPVTTSPEVLAGVLRSGAIPFLLDIEPEFYQIDPVLLEEVLEELKTAVVLLHRPAGLQVNPRLLELCEDLPTIIDTRLPPHLGMKPDCVGTFTLFDLSPIVGTGSIVIHKYSQQVNELKIVRNGLLGLTAQLNESLCSTALERFKQDPTLAAYKAARRKVADLFESELNEALNTDELPYFVVKVEDADRVVAFMHSEGIAIGKPLFPLHLLPQIAKRWAEPPAYPVAEELRNKLIALPLHPGILDNVTLIVSKLKEISAAIEQKVEEGSNG